MILSRVHHITDGSIGGVDGDGIKRALNTVVTSHVKCPW